MRNYPDELLNLSATFTVTTGRQGADAVEKGLEIDDEQCFAFRGDEVGGGS